MSLYSIHHDQRKWDDPEMFRPERFIDSDGKLNSVEEMFFFGFGKWLKFQYENVHNTMTCF